MIPLPSAALALSLLGGGSDDCGTATPITGNGFFAFDNSTATMGSEGQNESNCYSIASTHIDQDVWFEWTPSEDGLAVLRTCNTTTVATNSRGEPPGPGDCACHQERLELVW